MNNKALLVGINDYPNPNNNLRGCINDIVDMEYFITTKNKVYTKENIKTLTDSRATKKSILDHLFSESKVDKVLSKYFEVGATEKKLNEQKRMNKKLQTKHNVVKMMESVKKLSETFEQELASEKFLEENIGFQLVGKTNKKNLVFEHGTKQTKISPEGLLV